MFPGPLWGEAVTPTRAERRDLRRRNQRKHRVSGRSVLLLARVVQERAARVEVKKGQA